MIFHYSGVRKTILSTAVLVLGAAQTGWAEEFVINPYPLEGSKVEALQPAATSKLVEQKKEQAVPLEEEIAPQFIEPAAADHAPLELRMSSDMEALGQPQQSLPAKTIQVLSPYPKFEGWANNNDPVPSQSFTTTMQKNRIWDAAEGWNMEDVLRQWSQQEDVELIWAAGDGFNVIDEVNFPGNFEGAIVTLLEQYKGLNWRPVASLHVDPENGKRALLVQVSQDG